MDAIVKGNAWKFGDNLGTDSHIFSIKYTREYWNGADLNILSHHLLETVNPEFGQNVRSGDFIVAGKNFGCGKGHRTGVDCMKRLGVGALIATSVGTRFFRYSVYFALPILIFDNEQNDIEQDNQLEINIKNGIIKNISTGRVFQSKPLIPPNHPLFPIIEAGGQVQYVKNKIAEMKKRKKNKK